MQPTPFQPTLLRIFYDPERSLRDAGVNVGELLRTMGQDCCRVLAPCRPEPLRESEAVLESWD